MTIDPLDKPKQKRSPFHRLDVLVGTPPCDKGEGGGCPYRDLCYTGKLACAAFERYVIKGHTRLKPVAPTHEQWLALYGRRDKTYKRNAI